MPPSHARPPVRGRSVSAGSAPASDPAARCRYATAPSCVLALVALVTALAILAVPMLTRRPADPVQSGLERAWLSSARPSVACSPPPTLSDGLAPRSLPDDPTQLRDVLYGSVPANAPDADAVVAARIAELMREGCQDPNTRRTLLAVLATIPGMESRQADFHGHRAYLIGHPVPVDGVRRWLAFDVSSAAYLGEQDTP